VTGLATATSEGDPVLAIGGEVPLDDRFKHTHQALDGVDVMQPVTKYAQSALNIHSLPEVFANGVRAAESGRPGAAFLGLPKDVGLADYPGELASGWARPILQGPAASAEIQRAAELIKASRKPLLLLGMQASQPSMADALQRFVCGSGLPYCATFQGPGSWVAPEQFAGRVGLFRNQPGDQLLDAADCVITVGFDAVEFDPSLWNTGTTRPLVTPDTTLALDVGSHYIWMNRYFPAGHARQVLVSNGQQTLGVAVPWAMATNLCRPGQPVISVSGDGGFLFTATELETATRIGSRFVHLIWNSCSYNMVAFQEQAHYGRTAGVQLGHYNVEAFAEAFGCKGYRITDADQLGPVLREALQQSVPVLIDIPIDYSQNIKLMQDVHQDFIH
jgi:thiamine pyrophosphate-dependent acetolactate synthase large subunit-like protein